jgi:Peptidase of plants and bacteria
MKKILLGGLFSILALTALQAQDQSAGATRPRRITDWNKIGTYISKDSVSRGKYTLVFVNRDSAFQAAGEPIKKRMIDAFFTVYPKEARRFNKKTARKVTFIIDPDYQGVAAASNAIIRYSPKWMLQNPGDIDVVTHEVFHVVQSYPRGAGPGWLTEGITDYVRYKFGVDNAGARWSMPDYNPKHSYTNSYRITARFLAWGENKVNRKLVDELDAALRTKTYTPELWVKLTGKTLDELWQAYAQNPAL